MSRRQRTTAAPAQITDHRAKNAPRCPSDSLTSQLARRREAALRLPPLACGCQDPLAADHRAGRCRYGLAL